MSGPLAGLFSDQTLNASVHSAAIRAGTVHDGHIQNAEWISSRPPSWMVDPLCRQSLPPSLAERESQRISRSIRRPRHTRDTSTARAPMSSKSDIGTFKTRPCNETHGLTQRSAPTQRACIERHADACELFNAMHPPRKRQCHRKQTSAHITRP